MSGGFVPYNLRQNKAVERAVFIDLIQRLSRSTDVHIQDYTYVGFAGAFSEDFKFVHSVVGIKKMISIEEDKNVLKRQKWNSPINCIDFQFCTAENFIDKFQPETPVIAWLDFTSAKNIGDQLDQAEMLVSKLAPYDIFKITLNANERTLHPAITDRTTLFSDMREEAIRRLGNHLPDAFSLEDEDLDNKGYPKLLLLAVEHAMKSGMEGKPHHYFQPLSSFVYADSEQKMLTHTGIILPNTINKKDFLNETKISNWDLATTLWGKTRTSPIHISIPDMSVRERLFIDQQLPTKTPGAINRSLGLRLVSGSLDKSRVALESYKKFYRHYPFFSRIIV